MTRTTEMKEAPQTCTICQSSQMKSFVEEADYCAFICQNCSHIEAQFALQESQQDYHEQYDTEKHLASIKDTRSRQALTILETLKGLGTKAHNLLDLGCGQGEFAKICRAQGVHPLLGVDASEKARLTFAQMGIDFIKVDLSKIENLDKLAAEKPFHPRIITLLDVLEHFAGNQVRTILSSLRRHFSSLELLVIKVPIQNGIHFRIAKVLHHFGIKGPLRQLFQVGTFPAHAHYFSRHSLDLLFQNTGMKIQAKIFDRDFEPKSYQNRVQITRALPLFVINPLALFLAFIADRFHLQDSAIYFVSPDNMKLEKN